MDINNKNNLVNFEFNIPEKKSSQPTKSDLELKSTINDTLKIFIETYLSIPLKEKKIKRLMQYNNFINDILASSSDIPVQYLTNPRFDILGTSLDKYKYQFEDEQIIEILKKIIVKSMDTRYSSKLKLYYIDIASQLSNTDIQLLKDLKENTYEYILKFHVFQKNLVTNKYFIHRNNAFLELKDLSLNVLPDFNECLDNLARLNLLVPFEPTLFLNENNTPRASILFENIKQTANIDCPKDYILEYELSALKLTDLAKNIISLCLE